MVLLDKAIDMVLDTVIEEVNRNKQVIRLLKKLNLDSDPPPADFENVYRYALVEYGVGKPRPALKIFRQKEIQELFRQALEQNNPYGFLNQGETFLANHPLQPELEAENVDVRREFYEFAAVFIEVAKRTRTPAEILAEQKLDSLHRQIGTLQEHLNRLSTLEEMRTEMARLAAQTYPTLLEAEPLKDDIQTTQNSELSHAITNEEMLTPALKMARRNLAVLEEQAAAFGKLHMPAHLRIELEEKRKEVAELEKRVND